MAGLLAGWCSILKIAMAARDCVVWDCMDKTQMQTDFSTASSKHKGQTEKPLNHQPD